uniref:C-type lectin domain-containing protein n=1 Tax=Cyprinus carpio TaxID=7962 RepID=A0A8C2FYZ6_CYPCA
HVINSFLTAAVHTSLSSGCVLPKAYPMTGYGDWYKVGSHCVKYFGSPLNFSAAEVSIQVQKQSPWWTPVKPTQPTIYFYFFLFLFFKHVSLSQSGRFIWTDGSSWNYQIWTLGEPNTVFSYKEDCVEMNWNCKG